jgi:hypothetical protein
LSGPPRVRRMPCLPRASAPHGRPEERLHAVARSAAGPVLRFAAPSLLTPARRGESLLSSPTGRAHRAGHAGGLPTAVHCLRCLGVGSSTETPSLRAVDRDGEGSADLRRRVSANRPSRSTRTATETPSTESMLTTQRRGTGSSPGSRPTSLTNPRIVVVHGATSARRCRGITASRERTTTGRRPISGISHYQTSPRAGNGVTARPAASRNDAKSPYAFGSSRGCSS